MAEVRCDLNSERISKMLTLEQLLLLIENDGWQDAVLSAGNLFFCFTLVPMLRHPDKPPVLTSIPTALALLAGGLVFVNPHPWLTAFYQQKKRQNARARC